MFTFLFVWYLVIFMSLIPGLDGAAGVIVVAVKTSDKDTLNNYRWGYFLACASSGITIILSIMLFLTRNVRAGTEKSRASRTADYVYNSGLYSWSK